MWACQLEAPACSQASTALTQSKKVPAMSHGASSSTQWLLMAARACTSSFWPSAAWWEHQLIRVGWCVRMIICCSASALAGVCTASCSKTQCSLCLSTGAHNVGSAWYKGMWDVTKLPKKANLAWACGACAGKSVREWCFCRAARWPLSVWAGRSCCLVPFPAPCRIPSFSRFMIIQDSSSSLKDPSVLLSKASLGHPQTCYWARGACTWSQTKCLQGFTRGLQKGLSVRECDC